MNTKNRKELYKAASERAIDWIASHQQQDGGFGEMSLRLYSLIGAVLLHGGRPEEAARLMPYLKKHFVAADGDFDMPEIRAGEENSLLEYVYAPSWTIFSAHINLATDISLPAMPHVLRYQDPRTGGLFGSAEERDRGKGIIHPAVTCIAGVAALITGHVAEARRMGDHLVDNLIGQNPDLARAFYPVWDTERGLRTDDDTPTTRNMPKSLIRDQPAQYHFLTGMMIALLSDLYGVTRDRKYLEGALTLYDFSDGGTDAIYQSTLSHKFAWGCAWLYRQTGQSRHLDSACRVCDHLLETQEADGSFVYRALVKSTENWPFTARLGITIQFALWIRYTLHLL